MRPLRDRETSWLEIAEQTAGSVSKADTLNSRGEFFSPSAAPNSKGREGFSCLGVSTVSCLREQQKDKRTKNSFKTVLKIVEPGILVYRSETRRKEGE